MLIPKEKLQRIVIIGNSGSGKTHAASLIRERISHNIIHFDKLFWKADGFDQKRPKEVVLEELRALSEEDQWIMEGVFGDMASLSLKRATSLIFMDKSWDECHQALLSRGPQLAKEMDKIKAENSFQELLDWAAKYWERQTLSSFSGHVKLFNEFTGFKVRITNRDVFAEFLEK